MDNKGHSKEIAASRHTTNGAANTDFVLDKFIFSNVFEKDIRRIYIYRKCERLAKAIQLIAPAFASTPSLRNRLDSIAVGLIDAAILPPMAAREALSRELLALSSLLSVARASLILSDMNADLITREAHMLLQEVASYETPRLTLEEVPTLAEFAKQVARQEGRVEHRVGEYVGTTSEVGAARQSYKGHTDSPKNAPDPIGHIKDMQRQSGRQDAILEVLRTKGTVYIKDISLLIRDVSEKTIQRELQALIMEGMVQKTGDRRWTQYSLAQH